MPTEAGIRANGSSTSSTGLGMRRGPTVLSLPGILSQVKSRGRESSAGATEATTRETSYKTK
jgi:hypothetical protein